MPIDLDAFHSDLGQPPQSKRAPGSRIERKLTERRPKNSQAIMGRVSPGDTKRKQHAQAQKTQRDRMKVALRRMAQMMDHGGVHAGKGSGTKAELVEAAVEYIRTLQGQIEALRGDATRPCEVGESEFPV
ncbi:hypothetical protein BDV12DRAFT_202324 [Aspergillus spectabilis]